MDTIHKEQSKVKFSRKFLLAQMDMAKAEIQRLIGITQYCQHLLGTLDFSGEEGANSSTKE